MSASFVKKQRRKIAKIHLILAFVFGIPVLIGGITGAILSFERELERALYPGLYKVASGDQPLPVQTLFDTVSEAFPDKTMRLIWLPHTADEAVRFQSTGSIPTQVFVNPHTGEIIGSRSMAASVAAVTRSIHTTFLAGKIGSRISGASALALALLLCSGTMLWWTTSLRKRKSIWRVRDRGHVANYDRHILIGLVMALPLFILSITGAVFSFPELFRPVIYGITASAPPPPRPNHVDVPENPQPFNLDVMLELSAEAAPGTMATIIALPRSPDRPLRINRRAPEEAHHTGRHYTLIDPWRARVLEQRKPGDASTGHKMIMANRVLHTGELGGMPLRLLFFVTSLAAPFLFATGLIHWWVPRRKRKSVRRTSHESAVRARAA